MRRTHLLLLAALLGGALGMAPAADTADVADAANAADVRTQGPIGVCAHVPRVHPKPICVLVDPAP